jgi:hypothetical protein
MKTERDVRRRLDALTKDIIEMLHDEFYHGLAVGEDVAYARDQVQRGNVISDEQVKLLREYDPDALESTPYGPDK